MTTSGVYVLSVSGDEIIRQAMLDLGKLGEGQIPSPGETVDARLRLNMMTRQWMGKADFAPGLKMWTRQRADLFLSNSTGQYALGPSGDNWATTSYSRTTTATANAAATALLVSSITNASAGDYIGVVLDSGALFWTTINGAPAGSTINLASGLPSRASSGATVFNYTTKAQRPVNIETVVLRDSTNSDTPMNLMTLQDYEFLPSKVDPSFISDPTGIYYEAQLTNGVLYTDVAGCSDVTKRLHIVYLQPIQTFVNPLDTPYFPEGWYRALVWGLAKEIGPMFNATFTKDMQDNYTTALALAREQDGETNTFYFQPGND